MQSTTDLLTTAFLGPWVKPAGAPDRRQVYLSLAHWWEAAKFMPHRPDLRDALLFSPSFKEARKFGRTRKESWRSDWAMTRHSVLIAGLGILAIQRPELELRSCPLAEIRAGLSTMDLPERFLELCLERFATWRAAPRVSVFGAEAAPDQVVGARMAKLVAPLPNWTLVTSCHRKAPWRVHDWALTHYIPVEYHGSSTERPSRRLAREILERSDQVVVFEQRNDKRFDHVLQGAKALKCKLTLELYAAEGQGPRQLSIT
jgi:hypothetical protein